MLIENIFNIPENYSGKLVVKREPFTFIINFSNGKKHNNDGPALISFYNETECEREWWLNGKRHRVTGPAYERVMGSELIQQYWLNNEEYSFESWFELLTPEEKEKMLWKMDEWG